MCIGPDQFASSGETDHTCTRRRVGWMSGSWDDRGGSSLMAMPMPLDARLRDEAALAEIELTSRLMIAASDYERHLTQREVDELLGVVAR